LKVSPLNNYKILKSSLSNEIDIPQHAEMQCQKLHLKQLPPEDQLYLNKNNRFRVQSRVLRKADNKNKLGRVSNYSSGFREQGISRVIWWKATFWWKVSVWAS